ncbi:hypothetical protein MRB53_037339 [Persea americana]|nr:hypothetical protein MRB53_037339 [Persea americana]
MSRKRRRKRKRNRKKNRWSIRPRPARYRNASFRVVWRSPMREGAEGRSSDEKRRSRLDISTWRWHCRWAWLGRVVSGWSSMRRGREGWSDTTSYVDVDIDVDTEWCPSLIRLPSRPC